jgi:hypothetical protein
MKKIYKSGTSIAINVVLKDGKNVHVAFMPLSNGSSRFVTDDEDLQYAIEHHHNYGKLFKFGGVVEEKVAAPVKEVVKEAKVKEIHVSDIASAKDYLSDHFGISRTQMRTTKAIMDFAAANGVKFVGLE